VLAATGAVEAEDAESAAAGELPIVIELPVAGRVPSLLPERKAS
jgi:hypothetical protein